MRSLPQQPTELIPAPFRAELLNAGAWRKLPWVSIPLFVRTYHGLHRTFGTDVTLGVLDAMPDKAFLKIKHFGPMSLADMRHEIANARRQPQQPCSTCLER